jgi:copper ion binding protein
MPTVPETLRDAGVTRVHSATTGVGAGLPGNRRIELPVAGLSCQKCVQAVESALRAVPGVGRATVNLAGGRVFVEYDPAQTTLSALQEAVKAAGYRVGTAKARFGIRDITCASCVTQIEKALLETPGVLRANVNVGTEEARWSTCRASPTSRRSRQGWARPATESWTRRHPPGRTGHAAAARPGGKGLKAD